MHAKRVDLSTICGGAVPEIFNRELQEIMANITDPNTSVKKSRRIVLTFDFEPMADRKSVAISFGINSKLVPVAAVESNMFITEQAGQLEAFTNDIRQEELFDPESRPIKTT